MLEVQQAVVRLAVAILRARELEMPEWLVRPGWTEARRRWPLVRKVYSSLEPGRELPDAMRVVERRTVDAVIQRKGEQPRVLEVDEKQHFNQYRADTLRLYPASIVVAFPKRLWLEQCATKRKLEGGGFAAPRPPLFPGINGRHRQRAFRDALSDILPPAHGYLPTLRVGAFEVESWIFSASAKARLTQLLQQRLGLDLAQLSRR
jgi:hypothetical protein